MSNEVYCFCRTSDVSRFMIGCDHCEEWYHGDCVKITEKESKYIKKYYCKTCRDLNPNLQILYKRAKDDREGKEFKREDKEKKSSGKISSRSEKGSFREREKSHKIPLRDESEDEKRKRKRRERESKNSKEEKSFKNEIKASKEQTCSSSSPRVEDVKEIEISSLLQTSSESILNSPPPPPSILSSETSKKQFLMTEKRDYTDDEIWEPYHYEAERKLLKEKINSKKRSSTTSTTLNFSSKSKKTKEDESENEIVETHTSFSTPLQCLAKCTKSARIGSKYCSDQCGINLASLRIYQTLPDRIREWNLTPCIAESKNRKELENIRSQQEVVKKRLEKLGEDFGKLEKLIAKGKSLVIDEKEDEEDKEDMASEITVHCVTCGQDTSAKTAIRHMERCYNRMESQTSFASKFKTQIDDQRMFCDYYNPKEQTYCKRLQVLCPEHNRDSIPSDTEVCGYPIQENLFVDPTDFCRKSKKSCQLHFSWEKLRRAEIDMERVRQWMKVDELIELERVMRNTMSSRGGVLGLMLHSTYNHEYEQRWQAQRAAVALRQLNHTKKEIQT